MADANAERGQARDSVPQAGGWGGGCVQVYPPHPGESWESAVSLPLPVTLGQTGDFFIKTLLPLNSSSL